MSSRGITTENLLLLLPSALTRDQTIRALAEINAKAMEKRLAEIDRVRVIANIDGLDEALLDILAHDFKVDWWDGNYSLEEKRRTLKGSWMVHRSLGTKAAVETAIRAIYPLSQVEEWFQYGGEPYHFRLNINITSDGGDKERQRRVLERMNYYKSLRSHNDGVRYFLIPEKSWATAGGALSGSREEVRREIVVPKLTRPGAKAAVLMGGTLTTARLHQRAELRLPKLDKPGAKAAATAGGALLSACLVQRVRVMMPRLTRAGATAKAAAGGAISSYQRQEVRVTM